MSDPYVLGVLDLFVIGGVTGLLLYFFVFRKTSKEGPAFKKLTVGYLKFVRICLSVWINEMILMCFFVVLLKVF